MTNLRNPFLLTVHAMECPFCRGVDLNLNERETSFWIHCKKCGANGPPGSSAEQALEHWNWNEYSRGAESVG